MEWYTHWRKFGFVQIVYYGLFFGLDYHILINWSRHGGADKGMADIIGKWRKRNRKKSWEKKGSQIPCTVLYEYY